MNENKALQVLKNEIAKKEAQLVDLWAQFDQADANDPHGQLVTVKKIQELSASLDALRQLWVVMVQEKVT